MSFMLSRTMSSTGAPAPNGTWRRSLLNRWGDAICFLCTPICVCRQFCDVGRPHPLRRGAHFAMDRGCSTFRTTDRAGSDYSVPIMVRRLYGSFVYTFAERVTDLAVTPPGSKAPHAPAATNRPWLGER